MCLRGMVWLCCNWLSLGKTSQSSRGKGASLQQGHHTRTIQEGSCLPITWAASANQTINSLCEKPQKWPLCLPHKLKHRVGVQDWWTLYKTFKISNGACLSTTRNISCNQIRQITFMWTLESLKSQCIPTVNSVPHGDQIERLWGGMWGLQHSAEPSVQHS